MNTAPDLELESIDIIDLDEDGPPPAKTIRPPRVRRAAIVVLLVPALIAGVLAVRFHNQRDHAAAATSHLRAEARTRSAEVDSLRESLDVLTLASAQVGKLSGSQHFDLRGVHGGRIQVEAMGWGGDAVVFVLDAIGERAASFEVVRIDCDNGNRATNEDSSVVVGTPSHPVSIVIVAAPADTAGAVWRVTERTPTGHVPETGGDESNYDDIGGVHGPLLGYASASLIPGGRSGFDPCR